MFLFYAEDSAQQSSQALWGPYHHDTHENASPPLEIAVTGCTILCGGMENVPETQPQNKEHRLEANCFQPVYSLL